MRSLGGLFGLGGVLLVGIANAQPFELGHVLSIRFLEELTAPESDDEIVVIHEQLGAAVTIHRGHARNEVTYLRGTGNLWAQIAEQIAGATARGERMHLEVQQWDLDTESCPSLSEKISAFVKELDKTASDLWGASNTDGEIIVDNASFLIETGAKDASITIKPSAAFEPPLYKAAEALHQVASRCTESREPEVERHDF